ncbi:MAG: hypothetical protein H5T63_11505 [Chloroflexi bacterium]|nr:hypothetical protein [Chloroflexota bacterium]
MPYFLAIDAGTTSAKVILFDGGGNPIATSIQEYRLSTLPRIGLSWKLSSIGGLV